MVYNTTQQPPPSQPHTVRILWEGGERWGRWERRYMKRGNSSQKGSKIPTWLTVSPVYKLYWTPVKTTFRAWCLYSSFVHGLYTGTWSWLCTWISGGPTWLFGAWQWWWWWWCNTCGTALHHTILGYSEFHNLMRFTSKKMPNILKNVC